MTVNRRAAKRAARNDKFKYPFELDEYQIGIKLAHFFGMLDMATGLNFQLESSIEGKTGADYECQGIQARYYLQAKAPIALMNVDTVPIPVGKEREGLNAIRAYRRDNNLADDPYSLCFGLRRPAKHAKVPEELQHNLLYASNDPGKNSHAMYVAPTTYVARDYLNLLRDDSFRHRLWNYGHWHSRSENVWGVPPQLAAEILINSPFLQAHICITPHAKVDTHEHHYSYSVHANSVAFHSPSVLEGVSQNLSDFLGVQARQLGQYETQSTESVLEDLKRALPESVIQQALQTSSQDHPLAAIRQIGRVLKDDHGIIQYLVKKRNRD